MGTDQLIDGIPVIDARVNILVDPSGEILMVNSLFVPQGKASRTPQISLQAARDKLTQTLVDPAQADRQSAQVSTAGSLAFWTDGGNEETPVLLWMIDATIILQGKSQTVSYGVDAATGDVRYSVQGSFGLNRTVYTKLPLSLDRVERQPSLDRGRCS